MEAAVVAFKIPEEIDDVLRWFMEALWALSGVRYRESQGVGLFLGAPTEENPGDPDVTRDIVVAAYRRREAPNLSIWEYWHDGRKVETELLGPAMQFRFFGRRGETYVWAICAEHLSPVVLAFEDFLTQIEARYPVVGPLAQEYEAQRIERVKESLQAQFGGAPRRRVPRLREAAGGAAPGGASRQSKSRMAPSPARSPVPARPYGPGAQPGRAARGRTTARQWAVYEAETRIARIPEHPEKRKKKQVVRAMRQEGRTLEEIAEAVEISLSTVKRWLREMS